MTSVEPTDRALPLGELLAGLLLLAVSGIYALTTLLYVSPPNPLRNYFDVKLTAFEQWGYQKWTFFAPPPTGNDRLYIAFTTKDGEGETMEVLEGIYARKQQDNPVNTKTQVVDYVVSGSARQTSDRIHEIFRYRKVHNLYEGDPAYLNDLAVQSLEPDTGWGNGIEVLLRYAATIAADQGIELDGLKCQIAFTTVPLRPFSQRYNSEFPFEEKMVYKTRLQDVPQLADQ